MHNINRLFKQIIQYRQFQEQPLHINIMRTRQPPTPLKSPFISVPRVEADQKSLILDKLRNESESLRKNEQQFAMLKQQYSELDRKYRAQLQQKTLQESDFKNRHECAVRAINQLKNEVDAIRIQLRDKKLEIEDLRVDEEALKNSIDQRNIEIQKLRNDINSLLCDGQELQNQRLSFVGQVQTLRKNNAALSQSLFNLQKQNQACNYRLGDLQKYLQQLDAQSKILTQKIKDFQDANNDLDNNIQTLLYQLAQMQNLIAQCQQDCANLQKSNASLSTNVDQFKSEAIHNQKAAQAEVMKNNDLVKKLKQAENILKVRLGQVEDGHTQIEGLREQNQKLDKINHQLSQDLQACRKHLENLGLLNHQLISTLENFSQEDKRVSEIINRQHRVKYLNERVQQTSSIQFYNGKDTARTDVSFTSSRRKFRL